MKNEKITAFFFCLPALIPLIVFWIGPMIFAFYLSMTNWDLMMPVYDMVGLENYQDLFTDPRFYDTLWNTLYFTVGSVIPAVLGGLLLAVLLKGKVIAKTFHRTLLFSPWVTPLVAMAIVWSWLFNPRRGLINFILVSLNFPALPWASSSTWAMPVVIIVSVWRTLGWAMVFYLVALDKIPETIYDAAKIDGATFWKKLRYITLPLVSPTTLFLSVVLTVEALRAFDQIDIITQGGPAGATRTLLYHYYQSAFQRFNAGEAAAIGIVILLISGVFAIAQFIISKKFVHYQ
ncbi:sugar ABC transporter permease [Halanaerobiaceae bacterium Z-7014]|uniref:Sugar ABC transporter permease n=2 Tax=Halonatronomonas betaini TaxID=2778430 RepID=A0A931F7J3_9FIRM|nr:sugar ABC transporter permease [Halonatronomonas betaini]